MVQKTSTARTEHVKKNLFFRILALCGFLVFGFLAHLPRAGAAGQIGNPNYDDSCLKSAWGIVSSWNPVHDYPCVYGKIKFDQTNYPQELQNGGKILSVSLRIADVDGGSAPIVNKDFTVQIWDSRLRVYSPIAASVEVSSTSQWSLFTFYYDPNSTVNLNTDKLLAIDYLLGQNGTVAWGATAGIAGVSVSSTFNLADSPYDPGQVFDGKLPYFQINAKTLAFLNPGS